MNKLKFSKEALNIAILTLVTILFWIGFEVYQSLTKIDIPQVLQKQTEPLDTTISFPIIEGLKQRNSFTEQELQNIEKQISEESSLSGVAKETTESGIIDQD